MITQKPIEYPWMHGFDAIVETVYHKKPDDANTPQELLVQVGIRQCALETCDYDPCIAELQDHLDGEIEVGNRMENLDLYIEGANAAVSVLVVRGEN